jgi:hypothetical protein
MYHSRYSHSYPVTYSSLFYLDRHKKENKKEKKNISNRIKKITFPKLIRQYTFTCEQDFIDIKEGFCPNYAIYWLDEQNSCHWPKGYEIRHRPEYLEKKETMSQNSSMDNFQSISSLSNHSSFSESNMDCDNNKTVHFDLFREVIPIYDDYST